MKMQAMIMGALALAIMPACAKQTTVVHPVVREFALDDCHFKLTDPYQAWFDTDTVSNPHSASYIANGINPKARHPFATSIQFSCENPATAKTYLDSASIKLTPKGWALDLSNEDPRPPSSHTTLYLLHGNGWEGAGTTQDATDGDEDRRTRTFGFCIPHKSYALCGMVQHVGYLMWPKETVLPQVIKLLDSIEFIDTPASSSTTAKP